MPTIFNSVNLNDIVYNGVTLNKVVFNGTLVFEKGNTPVLPSVNNNLDTAIFTVKRYNLDYSSVEPVEQKAVSNPYLSGIVRGVGDAEILEEYKSKEEITVPAGTYILFEKSTFSNPGMTHFAENSARLVTFNEETTIKIEANTAATALFIIAKVSGVTSIGNYVGTAIEQGVEKGVLETIQADMRLEANQDYLVFTKFSGGNTQGGSYSVLLNDTLHAANGAGTVGVFPINPCYGNVKNSTNSDNHIHVQYQQNNKDIRVSMIMIAIPVF